MAEQIGNKPEEIQKYLGELDQEMDQYKEEYVSKGWDGIPDFFRGKTHWSEKRPSHKVSPVLNFLRQAIERKTSQMTDTKPFISILPFYDPLTRCAEALEDIISSKWSEQTLDMTLTDIVFYAELFGSCGVNTTYDRTLLHGIGDSTFQTIDPRNFNFDPACTCSYFLDRAEYVRIEDIKPTSLMKYMYQDYASDIKPDAPVDFYTPERKNYDRRGRIIRRVIDRMSRKKGTGALDRSLIREYWVQDRTLVGKNLKYPGGRHFIIAGGVLVLDEKNPYWDERFPTDMLDWHRNPDSAWGDGELEDLKQLQVLLNKLVAIVIENGIMQSNGIWIGDYNALKPDEWNKLDNVPGLKVKKKPGSDLRREPGVAIPGTVFNTIQYLENAIEKLAGNTEVVQGGAPGEVRSGVAIEALQQAAMAIVRLKARCVESLLERIGQKMISRIFQFEGGERQMWRIRDDKYYEAFKYTSDILRGDSKETKKYLKNKKDAWKNFLFKIRPGSSMAMNKWQETAMALQLYQAQPKPIIDREAVLDIIELPNRTETLQRMIDRERIDQENAIALMAMQSQARTGAAGPPPSGEKGGSAPGAPLPPSSPHQQQAVREALSKGQGIQR